MKRVKIENCTLPPGAVYIGRRHWCGKKLFKASPWANYFYVSRYGREGAVERYRQKLLRRPDLLERLPKDKDLACWCDLDKPCHGDVLLQLREERE